MFGQMRRIFPAQDAQMSARIARLCVLYEDLRIELLGVTNEIPLLDEVGSELRMHYFLRRSIATLHEFSEALRLLDEFPDFPRVTGIFPNETGSISTASATTQSDANRRFLVSEE